MLYLYLEKNAPNLAKNRRPSGNPIFRPTEHKTFLKNYAICQTRFRPWGKAVPFNPGEMFSLTGGINGLSLAQHLSLVFLWKGVLKETNRKPVPPDIGILCQLCVF